MQSTGMEWCHHRTVDTLWEASSPWTWPLIARSCAHGSCADAGVRFGFKLKAPGDQFHLFRHVEADLEPLARPSGCLDALVQGFGQCPGKGANLPRVLPVEKGPPFVLRGLPHQLAQCRRNGHRVPPHLSSPHKTLHRPQTVPKQADQLFFEPFNSSVATVAQVPVKAVQGFWQDRVAVLTFPAQLRTFWAIFPTVGDVTTRPM